MGSKKTPPTSSKVSFEFQALKILLASISFALVSFALPTFANTDNADNSDTDKQKSKHYIFGELAQNKYKDLETLIKTLMKPYKTLLLTL